ncbi:hypothetical protein HPB51_006561 [Rhipicephalus microplus]|uniref:Aldehyde dehydrogenase domain-containing protein n=1 Tax=Rhipicephalus microplus TaxID=6941 RepID=A0A9J6E7J8_RHIMP|nr:hypothetical protein HPB51_006561 [Rhipicephalus microplus]
MNDQELHQRKIFINNKFVDSFSGNTFATFNPANEEKIADVQEGTKEDIDAAVKAAREAFKRGSKWRTMDASQRGALINRLADLMEQNADYMAVLFDSYSCREFRPSGFSVRARISRNFRG